MTLQEAYFFLLIDSFMVSIILPVQESLAFIVMKEFGNYNNYLMIFIASLGLTLGQIANCLLGKAAAKTFKFNHSNKITNFFQKNSYLILLLVWVPILGSIISIFYGFLNSKFKLFLPIVFSVNVIYHSLAIFY